MATSEQEWTDRVQEAVVAKDPTALRGLYVEAQRLFGEHAGERWAQAMSAFDSSAVTG